MGIGKAIDFKDIRPYEFDETKAKHINFQDIKWGCLNIRNVLGDVLVKSYHHSPNCYIYVSPKDVLGLPGDIVYHEGVYPYLRRLGEDVAVDEFRKDILSKCGKMVYELIYLSVRYLQEGYDALAVSFFINTKDMREIYRKLHGRREAKGGCELSDYFDYSAFGRTISHLLGLFNIPALVETEMYSTDTYTELAEPTPQLRRFRHFPDNFGAHWSITGCYDKE